VRARNGETDSQSVRQTEPVTETEAETETETETERDETDREIE
jgi:hypothetical protein